MGSIELAGGQSGTRFLFDVLSTAAGTFSNDFAGAEFPSEERRFRKSYPAALPRFEAARLASPNRPEITRLLAEATARKLVWLEDGKSMPLAEMLQGPGQALALSSEHSERAGWKASITCDGICYPLEDLGKLGRSLCSRNIISGAAASSFEWLASNAGEINLQSRKIAVLGASAEMAPTRFLLEAGADVLWIDINPPPEELRSSLPGGRLSWVTDGADLLTQPAGVLATIRKFAEGQPVDIALYAYAPGQAREIRLTGAMNAIVDAMPAEAIASVTLLVSPTTPTGLAAADLDAMQARLEARPRWEALLAAAGALGKPGAAVCGSAAATRTVVDIQGSSYQAAQYLGKVIMAESWATAPQPIRVSANTAAITKTRSLSHPVFDAAFGGASAFGIETLTPDQSQRMNGLLAIRDWLAPDMPAPGSVRVHGGIHTLPYPLQSAMLSAAAIGFARSPKLLTALLSR